MQEDMSVYQTLRDTIVNCESSTRNLMSNMYVVYFAMLAFGLQQKWLIYLTFVVLIVFQGMVNSERQAIGRASVYIRVFFEETRKDIHWETFNADELSQKVYHGQTRKFGWMIGKAGCSVLALMSLGILSWMLLDEYTGHYMTYGFWSQTLLGITLFGMAVLENYRAMDLIENNEAIYQAVKDFYNRVYKK